MGSVTTVRQPFYQSSLPPITIEHCPFASLTTETISNLTVTLDGGTRLGVAASYGKKCVLKALAFSSGTRVLLITMDGAQPSKRKKQILKTGLLCCESLEKHGFYMERIAASLYLDLDLHIQSAFDIGSEGNTRGSLAAYKDVLRQAWPRDGFDEKAVKPIFIEKPFDLSQKNQFALRAWACYIAVQPAPQRVDRIDTSVKHPEELKWMCRCARNTHQIDSSKPHYTKNDISDEVRITSKAVDLRCTRFKTRMRSSRNQHIRIDTNRGKMKGHVKEVQGRAVRVTPQTSLAPTAQITSVVTVGKDDPTPLEASREGLILDVFKGAEDLLGSPFVRKIFFPDYPLHKLKWPKLPTFLPRIKFTYRQLNDSQQRAVEKCISNKKDDRHVVIIGPPGTGKTTVIAAIAQSKVAEHISNTVWIVAQSNVAVKNVAEKLVDSGFLDFKLLVSKDFYFDWHEHLYEEILRNVIQSANFGPDAPSNERLLMGSRVILCTICTLSKHKVVEVGFTQLVPVQTVIVDEASQIEAGDYLPVLAKFKTSLRKMVFIGDDKQLAPYGQEQIEGLRSVFEWPHLLNNTIFLDTQYRMPKVVGNLISRHVYGSKLRTQHTISTKKCCRFVDVRDGKETKKGVSHVNESEVKVAVQIAKRYIQDKKKFKIITPYDAQRNAIESALKTAGLTWENTVFNVDTFQGSEEDHIIISVVRTLRLGFLGNMRRTNVMLSRCKKSMVILTHRGLIESSDVAKTLVGKFAKEHASKVGWLALEELATHRW